jgi:hypothetical protein
MWQRITAVPHVVGMKADDVADRLSQLHRYEVPVVPDRQRLRCTEGLGNAIAPCQPAQLSRAYRTVRLKRVRTHERLVAEVPRRDAVVAGMASDNIVQVGTEQCFHRGYRVRRRVDVRKEWLAAVPHRQAWNDVVEWDSPPIAHGVAPTIEQDRYDGHIVATECLQPALKGVEKPPRRPLVRLV